MASPDLAHPPVVICQPRRAAALAAAVFGALVAIGAWLAVHPDFAWLGGLTVAVFGLFLLVALAQLLRPNTLTLTPDGMTQHVLGRRRTWTWDEVSNFRVWAGPTTLVTFDSKQPRADRWRRLNAGLGAGADSLASLWETPPQALADLLNAARARWAYTV